MNLHLSLPWLHSTPARRPARPAPPDWVNATLQAAPPPDDAEPGCGWFDSSHALESGLQVTEHATPDSVANAVPLGWWLDWQLNGNTRSAQA